MIYNIREVDQLCLSDNTRALIFKTRDERITRLSDPREYGPLAKAVIDCIMQMDAMSYLAIEGIVASKACQELATKFDKAGFARVSYDFTKLGWLVGYCPERYATAKQIEIMFDE